MQVRKHGSVQISLILFSHHIRDVQQGEHYAVDLIFECSIRGDAEFVLVSIPRFDTFVSWCDIAHHIEHPPLQFWKIEMKRQVGKSLAHVVAAESEYPLRLRREPANVQVF